MTDEPPHNKKPGENNARTSGEARVKERAQPQGRADLERFHDQAMDVWNRLAHLKSGDARERELRKAALNLLEDAILARDAEKQEIAERERAEEELRAGNERLRAVFDSMNEAFVIKEAIFDKEGRVIDFRFIECNAAFKRLIRHENPTGHTVLELMPGIEPVWLSNYEKVIATGEPAKFEAHLASRDCWLAVSASRLGGPGSDRVAIISNDVTASRQAREALRASEERLRLIVENAREYAIFSTDLERRVTSWNSGAERLLGWSEQEIMGKPADAIFIPEDRENNIPEKEAKTAILEGRATDERWHMRKDGTRFWGSGVMNAMRDADGTCIGLVKIFRDQTEQREARERLERSQSDLWEALQENEQARAAAEAATAAKNHFLALLSHELRTPLTPVVMAVQMLKRRKDLPATVNEALEMIDRNIVLEARFIDDLLDVTRIERGKLELQSTSMDLHDAIDAALEIATPDMEKKEQRLTRALDAEVHLVAGDPFRLQQVFWNLLKNASKFTPDGGVIKLASFNKENRIIVTVSDSGIGFVPEVSEKIFDPFSQADEKVTREYGGLGLGLAIAKAVVSGHGGDLYAQSDGPGRGATFTVELPAAEPAPRHGDLT
ncbi:MAG TPA: ATP-binding protein [Chthoniobacteraceae bacterium]|nr:ATP-binding protein [Chthoniobacteraceae bacterium]